MMKKVVGSVIAAGAVVTGTAHAEVPAAVLTAITEGGQDAATAAAAVISAYAGWKLIVWIRSLLR